MILQYKGFNNNWCYEEAEIITWANVNVDHTIEEYKFKTKKHNKENDSVSDDLGYAHGMHKAVNEYIIGQTHCPDNIIYLIGDLKFDEMTNVCVVTLKDDGKYLTYIFKSGVYILNNNGKTIQKIA